MDKPQAKADVVILQHKDSGRSVLFEIGTATPEIAQRVIQKAAQFGDVDTMTPVQFWFFVFPTLYDADEVIAYVLDGLRVVRAGGKA